MLRLAEDLQCPIVQKTVSQEIKEVLKCLFGTLGGEFNEDSIENAFLGDNLPEKDDRLWLQVLAIKIAAMIKELEDPDNEYTFDELGEYLVWKAIVAANEDEPGSGQGWCTSATTEEIKEVYSEAVRICGDIADELAYEEIITDDDSPSSRTEDSYYKLLSEQIDDFVGRAIYAPRLIREYTEEVYIPFVVWDLDFSFVEDVGINNWITFARENTDKLGFVEGTQGREPISGSLKSPLKKTKDFKVRP